LALGVPSVPWFPIAVHGRDLQATEEIAYSAPAIG
jgi:hypothetical protein